MEENNLKRHIFLILITLLLIATALKAGAEASKDENLSRYSPLPTRVNGTAILSC